MKDFLIVFGIVAGLVGLYVATYFLNGKTNAPEGVETMPQCATCGSSGACSIKGKYDSKSITQEQCEVEQAK